MPGFSAVQLSTGAFIEFASGATFSQVVPEIGPRDATTPSALLTSSIAMVIPMRYIVPFGVWNPESGKLAPILIGGLSAANNAELAITPISTAHPAANLRLFVMAFPPFV